MNILKCEGHKFPELKEADAMFASDVAPEWADGECCHRCRVAFGVLQRKHHCRNCGQVFCHQCSSKTSTLPKYGFEKEVRVCEGCFISLQRASFAPSANPAAKPAKDDALPEEYLKSSLAQQSQAPPSRSEQEIQEEEELQLALALSQSEAEEKAKMHAKIQAQYSVPRTYTAPRPPSPEQPLRSPSPDEMEKNPELAKYLNRDYWESKNTNNKESPLSPTAPSPMSSIASSIPLMKNPADDPELDEFTSLMRSQLDIFVNRMKSSSARGRNISNDTSIQALFLNISTLHSKLLTYIKEMDDKRMWYESLQDKIGQIKDSRAALDVLRQEHQEKLRRIAEEQERQRQIQMAHKLEIMRKKKQEYLQYQRQLALQRIQDQEREMQMRMEQQKAHYRMGGQPFAQQFSPMPGQPPMMTMPPGGPMPGAYGNYGYPPQMAPPGQQQQQNPQMMQGPPQQMQGQMPSGPQMNPAGVQQPPPPQQVGSGGMGMMPPQMIPGPGQNHPPQGLTNMQQGQPMAPPQMMHPQQQQPMAMPEQQQQQPPPQQAPVPQPVQQVAPVQVQTQPEKPAEPEPSIGELISFD